MQTKNIVIFGVVAVALIAGVVWFLASGGFAPTGDDELLTTSNDEPGVSGPVARVNGEEISSEQYNAQQAQVIAQYGIDATALDAPAKATLQAQVVDMLISRTLLDQAVASSGQTVDQAAVDAEINAIAGQFESDEAFNAALDAEGMTKEILGTRVASDLALQAYLDSQLDLQSITATEEEITAAYEQVATTEDIPPLEEVRPQVEALVIGQKQQEKINAHVAELRASSTVEVLI